MKLLEHILRPITISIATFLLGLVISAGIGQVIQPSSSFFGCVADANNQESCTSSVSGLPVKTLQNTTNDANPVSFIFKKTRNGGNVSAGDNIGIINFNAAAGSITPTMGQIESGYLTHTNGTNTVNAGTMLITSWDENNTPNGFVQSASGNHLGLTTAAARKPSITSCGTSPGSVAGNDTWGQVTEGTTATGCIINFGGVWSSAPTCVVSISSTTAAPVGITTSNTAGANNNGQLVVSHASVSSAQLFWHCNEST